MSKQITITIEEIDSILHKIRYLGRKYYLIDEEDTAVEIACRENDGDMPKELFPLLSWTNERIVIPYDIIDFLLKELIVNHE